ADPPLATATFLKPDQRAIEHLIGGRQDFAVTDDKPGLLTCLRPLAPRLKVIELLARHFDLDQGTIPSGRITALGVIGCPAKDAKAKNRRDEKRSAHKRRSFGMP